MSAHLLFDFFSPDPAAAMRAVAALCEPGAGPTCGAVTQPETFQAVAGEERLRLAPRGILSEVIFGPVLDAQCSCGATGGAGARGRICSRCGVLCDRASLRDERWGHVDVVQVVHPAVYAAVWDALGIFYRDAAEVAQGQKALRAEPANRAGETEQGDALRWSLIAGDFEDEDLSGPAGLAAALRRAAPNHPALPLCAITKVPVTPPGQRPLVAPATPLQVDPWIGPVNEAWLELVERAVRERRLVELEAAPAILRRESARVQQAFAAVFHRTQEAQEPLVPPLVRVPAALSAEEADAVAFVNFEQLLVQRRDRVLLLTLAGEALHVLPPTGTALRGVVQGRFAVFQGFFGATHPSLAEDPGFSDGFVRDDADGCRRVAHHSEISILDCQTGTYAERRPPGLRLVFAENDQPEDLFLTREDDAPPRRLRVGGDRPETLAYAPGFSAVWVGEEGSGTEIVELSRGIPYAYPCEPTAARAPRWDLRAGPLQTAAARAPDSDDCVDEDSDADEVYSGRAAAYRDGAWHLLWSSVVLCDHRTRSAVRLHPAPRAAAFDPTGRRLAVLIKDAVIVLDVVHRQVLHRFAVP